MKIILLPGDGIGPEICAGLQPVLAAADNRFGPELSLETADVGFAALTDTGTTLPPTVMQDARGCDGIVLGPLSTYDYPPASDGGINASAAFRKELDLYANLRPARCRLAVESAVSDMDLVVVHMENAPERTDGLFYHAAYWVAENFPAIEIDEALVDAAVDAQLSVSEERTRDLGGRLGTLAFAEAVAGRLAAGPA